MGPMERADPRLLFVEARCGVCVGSYENGPGHKVARSFIRGIKAGTKSGHERNRGIYIGANDGPVGTGNQIGQAGEGRAYGRRYTKNVDQGELRKFREINARWSHT